MHKNFYLFISHVQKEFSFEKTRHSSNFTQILFKHSKISKNPILGFIYGTIYQPSALPLRNPKKSSGSEIVAVPMPVPSQKNELGKKKDFIPSILH